MDYFHSSDGQSKDIEGNHKNFSPVELLVVIREYLQNKFVEKAELGCDTFLSTFVTNSSQKCECLLLKSQCILYKIEKNELIGSEAIKVTLEAVRTILLAFECAVQIHSKMDHSFLIYNISVDFWNSVKPRLRLGTRKYFVEAFEKIFDGIKLLFGSESETIDKSFLAVIGQNYSLCLSEQGLVEKAMNVATQTMTMIDELKDGDGGALRKLETLEDCLSVVSYVCRKENDSAKALVSARQIAAKYPSLASFVDCFLLECRLRERNSPVSATPEQIVQLIKRIDEQFSTEINQLLKEFQDYEAESAVDLSLLDKTFEPNVAGKGDDFIVNASVAKVSGLLKCAQFALMNCIIGDLKDKKELSLIGRTILEVCKQTKFLSQKVDSLLKIVEALAEATNPEDVQFNTSSNGKRSNALRIGRMVNALKWLERAMETAERANDYRMCLDAAILCWTLSLPCLCSNTKDRLLFSPFLHRAVDILDKYGAENEVASRIHFEIAKSELENDSVSKAILHTKKSLCSDFGVVNIQDEQLYNETRPLDVQSSNLYRKLDVKARLCDSPTTSEGKAHKALLECEGGIQKIDSLWKTQRFMLEPEADPNYDELKEPVECRKYRSLIWKELGEISLKLNEYELAKFAVGRLGNFSWDETCVDQIVHQAEALLQLAQYETTLEVNSNEPSNAIPNFLKSFSLSQSLKEDGLWLVEQVASVFINCQMWIFDDITHIQTVQNEVIDILLVFFNGLELSNNLLIKARFCEALLIVCGLKLTKGLEIENTEFSVEKILSWSSEIIKQSSVWDRYHIALVQKRTQIRVFEKKTIQQAINDCEQLDKSFSMLYCLEHNMLEDGTATVNECANIIRPLLQAGSEKLSMNRIIVIAECAARCCRISLKYNCVQMAQELAKCLEEFVEKKQQMPPGVYRWLSLSHCVWASAISVSFVGQAFETQDRLKRSALAHIRIACKYSIVEPSITSLVDCCGLFWKISERSTVKQRKTIKPELLLLLDHLKGFADNSEVPFGLLANMYLLLLDCLQDTQQWREALLACDEALSLLPANFKTAFQKARVLFGNKINKSSVFTPTTNSSSPSEQISILLSLAESQTKDKQKKLLDLALSKSNSSTLKAYVHLKLANFYHSFGMPKSDALKSVHNGMNLILTSEMLTSASEKKINERMLINGLQLSDAQNFLRHLFPDQSVQTISKDKGAALSLYDLVIFLRLCYQSLEILNTTSESSIILSLINYGCFRFWAKLLSISEKYTLFKMYAQLPPSERGKLSFEAFLESQNPVEFQFAESFEEWIGFDITNSIAFKIYEEFVSLHDANFDSPQSVIGKADTDLSDEECSILKELTVPMFEDEAFKFSSIQNDFPVILADLGKLFEALKKNGLLPSAGAICCIEKLLIFLMKKTSLFSEAGGVTLEPLETSLSLNECTIKIEANKIESALNSMRKIPSLVSETTIRRNLLERLRLIADDRRKMEKNVPEEIFPLEKPNLDTDIVLGARSYWLKSSLRCLELGFIDEAQSLALLAHEHATLLNDQDMTIESLLLQARCQLINGYLQDALETCSSLIQSQIILPPLGALSLTDCLVEVFIAQKQFKRGVKLIDGILNQVDEYSLDSTVSHLECWEGKMGILSNKVKLLCTCCKEISIRDGSWFDIWNDILNVFDSMVEIGKLMGPNKTLLASFCLLLETFVSLPVLEKEMDISLLFVSLSDLQSDDKSVCLRKSHFKHTASTSRIRVFSEMALAQFASLKEWSDCNKSWNSFSMIDTLGTRLRCGYSKFLAHISDRHLIALRNYRLSIKSKTMKNAPLRWLVSSGEKLQFTPLIEACEAICDEAFRFADEATNHARDGGKPFLHKCILNKCQILCSMNKCKKARYDIGLQSSKDQVFPEDILDQLEESRRLSFELYDRFSVTEVESCYADVLLSVKHTFKDQKRPKIETEEKTDDDDDNDEEATDAKPEEFVSIEKELEERLAKSILFAQSSKLWNLGVEALSSLRLDSKCCKCDCICRFSSSQISEWNFSMQKCIGELINVLDNENGGEEEELEFSTLMKDSVKKNAYALMISAFFRPNIQLDGSLKLARSLAFLVDQETCQKNVIDESSVVFSVIKQQDNLIAVAAVSKEGEMRYGCQIIPICEELESALKEMVILAQTLNSIPAKRSVNSSQATNGFFSMLQSDKNDSLLNDLFNKLLKKFKTHLSQLLDCEEILSIIHPPEIVDDASETVDESTSTDTPKKKVIIMVSPELFDLPWESLPLFENEWTQSFTRDFNLQSRFNRMFPNFMFQTDESFDFAKSDIVLKRSEVLGVCDSQSQANNSELMHTKTKKLFNIETGPILDASVETLLLPKCQQSLQSIVMQETGSIFGTVSPCSLIGTRNNLDVALLFDRSVTPESENSDNVKTAFIKNLWKERNLESKLGSEFISPELEWQSAQKASLLLSLAGYKSVLMNQFPATIFQNIYLMDSIVSDLTKPVELKHIREGVNIPTQTKSLGNALLRFRLKSIPTQELEIMMNEWEALEPYFNSGLSSENSQRQLGASDALSSTIRFNPILVGLDEVRME